ncbi:MAG: SDR family oxidoreductase [Candidatus Curtissbacteria bacterium]|nr:SDR family oxidoreductase [Candidatus Curtissbacteria bacterium]
MAVLNLFNLEGKVAVVTGALGLLGPVWSRALLEAGATVVGVDQKYAVIPKTFSLLQEEYGNKLGLLRADVLNRKQVEKAFLDCKTKFGLPLILVNNAGIDQPPTKVQEGYKFEDIPYEIGEKILTVNVLGAFLMIQVFGSEMARAKKGSIINVGSLYASVSPDPHFYDHIDVDPPFLKPPMYGPSKAALLNLTKYVAVMWGKYNVRVNVISPGGVFNNQDRRFVKKFNARVPLRRMARSEDIAGPLVFMASDASRYITGENIKVDGGFTAL